MLSLLARCLLLAALTALVLAGLHRLVPPNEQGYLAAQWDKQARLDSLHASGRPKLLIIGGSNVAFGVLASALEDSLGIASVNMGIHAGLGLEYMIRQVEPYAAKGDVFLLVPEYSQLYEPLLEPTPTLFQSLEVFPPAYGFCRRPNAWQQLRFRLGAWVQVAQLKFRRSLSRGLGLPETIPYRRDIFDAHGDLWTPLTLHSRYKADDKSMALDRGREPSDDFLQLANGLAGRCRQAGATAYLLFPAIAQSQWDEEVAGSLHQWLREHLDMPIANLPGQGVYPDTLFFDTKYHTTQAGRERRTREMIRDLMPLLQAAP